MVAAPQYIPRKENLHNLASFIGYILDNRFDEFILLQISLSRQVEAPLMKYFEQIPDAQMLETWRPPTLEYWNYMRHGRVDEQITDSIKKWKANQIPLISIDHVVAEDISKGSYVRKRALTQMLNGYTTDEELKNTIQAEIDFYLQLVNTATFHAFIEIQNELLKRREEQHQKMIAEVRDYAIILLDRDGNILNWNLGAEKIKGYKAEEILGKNFRLFYGEGDRANKLPEQLIGIAIETGRATHEGWRVRKDGSRFWGSVVITALHDNENKIIGFSKVTRDLTERKLAEENLQYFNEQLQKSNDTLSVQNKLLERNNKELQSINYIASHDLQEPLRKLRTFANMILETEEGALTLHGKELVNKLINSASTMQTLISDLLVYSRINYEAITFEEVDLNALVQAARRDILSTEVQATIEIAELPKIKGARFLWRQLIENVMSNSVKYLSADRPLAITVTCYKKDGRNILDQDAVDNKSYLVIEFKDNGIGFDQQYAGYIFEPFKRLHGRNVYSGNGVGLAICNKIVQAHGGFMYAEGRPGEGASVFIALPEEHHDEH